VHSTIKTNCGDMSKGDDEEVVSGELIK